MNYLLCQEVVEFVELGLAKITCQDPERHTPFELYRS